ncbi:hypothetical protein B5P46_28240 [Rhizobium leguminosarum]|uniref:Uncharacterized protein n=1 Tax=Rhizobium leguminosarum TaxID=384 RepID=A0A4Q1TKX7_RHILE|nr:hypothetical protein [Rhizobium leguminosarum]RXT18781.1 hypothetical protein B5P46_28240 [Rhizobium leguminosarum]
MNVGNDESGTKSKTTVTGGIVGKDIVAAVIDLTKSALWPALAFTMLIVFYEPVLTILDALSRRANQIESLKLGALEINIKLSNLPSASPHVAEAITGLDAVSIETLLSKDPNSATGYCDLFGKRNEGRLAAVRKLEAAKLFVAKPKDGTTWCGPGLDLTLTELGKQSQDFIFKLIASQIGAAN